MGTLLKYEFRRSRTIFLGIIGVTLLVELVYLVGFFTKVQALFTVGLIGGILCLALGAVAILLYGVIMFNDDISKKPGYLLFSTPRSAAQIVGAKLLMTLGLKDVILCDRTGAIYEGREKLNESKTAIAKVTNREMTKGTLKDAVVGADIFIGVSAPGVLTEEMIKTMHCDPIVLAMANPTPEIMPDEAKEAGARIVGTGRSDFPNQINNVVAFPGIFRGALDVRASQITENMKIAAAYAIASLVDDDKLTEDYILPYAFDERIKDTVASAVANAARKDGVARI